MGMTFIYESGREHSSSCSALGCRQWKNAGTMRLGVSMPTGSAPRPRLEHKMGGLHLPGALGVCDEAWVSWALLRRPELISSD